MQTKDDAVDRDEDTDRQTAITPVAISSEEILFLISLLESVFIYSPVYILNLCLSFVIIKN